MTDNLQSCYIAQLAKERRGKNKQKQIHWVYRVVRCVNEDVK